MAQRREQTAPAGDTALVDLGCLGTASTYRGNKESTLARSFPPHSHVEGPGEHKGAAHVEGLSTQCANTSVSIQVYYIEGHDPQTGIYSLDPNIM